MKILNVIKLKEKYSVVKSKEPEDDKTHLVVYECHSLYGHNYQRVYKGTYKECCEQKKLLEKEKEKYDKNRTRTTRTKRYN